MPPEIPSLIAVGPVRMEYFLLPGGKVCLNALGGPVLYAAAGAKLWTKETIGLISRVGNNFSRETLLSIERMGLDTTGIRILSDLPPSTGFHFFESWDKHIDWDPVKFLSKNHIPCPKDLLTYLPPSSGDGYSLHFPVEAIRIDDIPISYRQARAAYIAPCHYQSQVTLSVALRQYGLGTILLSPPEGLLLPSFRLKVREILHGIDILYAREKPIREFVNGPSQDPVGVSESLAHYGPKIILLQMGLQGIHLYDSDSRKGRFLPFYPVDMKNPLAIGDSFCGGFLAAWRKTFDPVESTLFGCVSASLAMEGLEGLYALQRNPGLADARLTSLRRSMGS